MSLSGQVVVTLASLSGLEPALPRDDLGWLSEEERARLDTFKAPRRRRQFLAGHYLARQCLAAHAGGAWRDHVLSAPEDAAPSVMRAGARSGRHGAAGSEHHISLSHSGDWLACAVASSPVGVDIEDTTRARDTDALGAMVLSEDELADNEGASPRERRERFFARWTLKEAWIKCAGPAAPPSMRAMPCFPCEPDAAQAVVVSCAAFTLAVTPARLEDLTLAGTVPAVFDRQPWRFVHPCCPDRLARPDDVRA